MLVNCKYYNLLSFPKVYTSVFCISQTSKFNEDMLNIMTVVAVFLIVALISENPPVMWHCFWFVILLGSTLHRFSLQHSQYSSLNSTCQEKIRRIRYFLNISHQIIDMRTKEVNRAYVWGLIAPNMKSLWTKFHLSSDIHLTSRS